MTEFWLSGCFPRRWRWEPFESFYSEIIVNWLDIEVDAKAEERLPILREVAGHRRREVREFLDVCRVWRSTEIADAIYGYPGACL